ncbi:MAG: protein translocase subunit SecD [Rhodovibrionaceae bacterium]
MIKIPRWQVIGTLLIVVLGILYALPNLVPKQEAGELPSWAPHQQVNLGLDLSGGSYLLAEVDLEGVYQEMLNDTLDGVRSALREQRIGYTNLRADGNAVVFDLRDDMGLDRLQEVFGALLSNTLMTQEEGNQIRIEVTDQARLERRNAVMQQTLEIIRRRIDETGTREPSIQRQGDDRVLIQLPGIEDPEGVKDLIGKTAKLTFRMVRTDVVAGQDSIPPGTEVLLSEEPGPNGEAIRYVVEKRVMVSGENLSNAQPTFQDGEPVVSIRFDSVGSKRFGQATSENVGRPFAIILDGEVISAPRINEAILGGSAIISGSFTTKESSDLALLLRAGALPASLTYIEERTVGPGLGADSIRAGEIACILGMVAVLIFMGVVYGFFGMIANIALVANLILILAALSVLQATLTLPGIAGIVLTIGMAVDANVLIFERIREEVHYNNRSPVTAIDNGYRRALTTILDSNITTLIAASLLFFFGTGPVKGFAVTLAIGLITSMFTAIMFARLITVTWLRRKRPQSLPI